VRNLTDFGAFVEVEEGVDGLVHISDLAWDKRISHPSEVIQKGDEVEAIILSIEPENQRLSLGIKQMTPSAWQTYLDEHKPGDVVKGTVSKLTDFGAFVELAEGVEGLIHVSEISEEHVEKAADHLKAGQEVESMIIKVNSAEKKISLSIRALTEESERAEIASYRAASSSGGASLGELAGLQALKEMADAAAAAETDTASEEAPAEEPAPEAETASEEETSEGMEAAATETSEEESPSDDASGEDSSEDTPSEKESDTES
jgi:predicted RNA-binding protein with RPS1 domain